jgi:signal transduction histidine kinase
MMPTQVRRSWLRLWLAAASAGTFILLALFFSYEAIERWWLLGRLPLERLFALHIARGVGATIIVSTLSIFMVLRLRQTYDRAFATAYRELEGEMQARSRALVQSQAFNERLFDALRDRLVVVDAAGTIVKANRVALDIAGRVSPIGKRCSGLGGACSRASTECVALKAHRLARPVVGEDERTDPRTGRIYAIDAYPLPDLDGSGPLVIETARDITRAKQLEAQIRYQEKLAALGVLAAGIAHDIANPLASMSSELEMIEEESDPARVKDSVAVLRGQVQRMDRTLREMTEFARRRGDEISVVSIRDAVEDALRMVRHDPRARKIAVEVDVPDGLPALRMVEDHLVMVVVNLLINSFDAMPDGGRVVLTGRRNADDVSLSIADDGVGMTDEVRRRAAEPLFTTKGRGRGTGLGLSVCAELLESVGGTLEIRSAAGTGTEVVLHFGKSAVASEPPPRCAS